MSGALNTAFAPRATNGRLSWITLVWMLLLQSGDPSISYVLTYISFPSTNPQRHCNGFICNLEFFFLIIVGVWVCDCNLLAI